MSEQITITMSLEQAEAVVAAVNCAATCAEGDLASLAGTWIPQATEESAASDNYMRHQAELGVQVARLLAPEIDGIYKRDPRMQDLLHAFKMHRKHGMDR